MHYFCLGMVVFAGVTGLIAQETNWPQFRGPRGDGTTAATALPLTWGETNHVRWQTPIPGRAWSSPVIWGDQLWLSTATTNGHELSALCVDVATGQIRRELKPFTIAKPQYAHPFNTYASPTPVIEEGRVYVTFGSPGTACLDTRTGQVLWDRRDFVCNHYRGAGSSPILYRDLFIVNFDGTDHQFVVALDKHTGKTVWRTERSVDYRDLGSDGKPETEGDFRKAFATCHVADLDGVATLLSQGSKALYAYDPLTGRERWRVEELSNYSGCTRPVVGLDLVFVPSGWSSGQLLAIRPGQPGEVVDAAVEPPAGTQLRVVWKTKSHVPKKPSLLLRGDLLFGVDDNGTVTCWEARTGTVVWSEHLGGNYSASPLAAGDRIYLFSEDGKTTVIAAGREFKKLAESQLGDGFMASPAVSGNALFLRSRTELYRIED
ncbi:MAG: PQQ-binding-like beta-propeller repeat protein [Verrucomicrobiota bacterium]|jgi:outer membrane protein assembly factor BamB